jgi:hypothetical protein
MFARFRFDAKRAREADAERRDGEEKGDERGREATAMAADRRVRVKAEPQPEPVAAVAATANAATVDTAHPAPAHKWQERFHAICVPCFDARRKCDHHAERRLRLLIVGHNPSDHAWMSKAWLGLRYD